MSIVSIRLPDDIERSLTREAERTHRAKSDIARQAIADYLTRQERDRYLTAIAKAARARGDAEALQLAGEALPLDNEAMERTRSFGEVREPSTRYKLQRRDRQDSSRAHHPS